MNTQLPADSIEAVTRGLASAGAPCPSNSRTSPTMSRANSLTPITRAGTSSPSPSRASTASRLAARTSDTRPAMRPSRKALSSLPSTRVAAFSSSQLSKPATLAVPTVSSISRNGTAIAG